MPFVERRSPARVARDRQINTRFWWVETVVMGIVAAALILAVVLEAVP